MRRAGERTAAHVFGLVRVAPLDELTEQKAFGTPIVIKIDVEGYEPEVLAGAPELLKLRPFIFLEHNPSEKSHAMLTMLSEQGYRLRHCQHSSHPGPPLTVEQAFALESAEMIFCEPGKAT